ncbi:MAG TPA: hypothetical protein VK988_21440, partial [Acidimicrobiales bacterium]|nr:hypothetical protein [Acidimicrobiales bacterium]
MLLVARAVPLEHRYGYQNEPGGAGSVVAVSLGSLPPLLRQDATLTSLAGRATATVAVPEAAR